MCLRRLRVQLERTANCAFSSGKSTVLLRISIVAKEKQGVRKADPGERVTRVGRDRTLEVVERLLQAPGAPLIQLLPTLRVEAISCEVLRRRLLDLPRFFLRAASR